MSTGSEASEESCHPLVLVSIPHTLRNRTILIRLHPRLNRIYRQLPSPTSIPSGNLPINLPSTQNTQQQNKKGHIPNSCRRKRSKTSRNSSAIPNCKILHRMLSRRRTSRSLAHGQRPTETHTPHTGCALVTARHVLCRLGTRGGDVVEWMMRRTRLGWMSFVCLTLRPAELAIDNPMQKESKTGELT